MQEILCFIDTWFRPLLVVFATIIGLYITFKKFGYSVSVTYKESYQRLSGSRITDIVITNHRDRPVNIFSVIAIFDKEIALTLQEFNPPLILKPYETLALETAPYSSLSINGDLFEPDLSFAEIQIETIDKLVKCKTRKKPKLHQNFRLATKKIRKFNGFVHRESYKYVLVYRINGNLKTTFIDNSGMFVNDWDFEFNKIKPANNNEIVADEIFIILKKYGLDKIFENYALYRIASNSYDLVEQ